MLCAQGLRGRKRNKMIFRAQKLAVREFVDFCIYLLYLGQEVREENRLLGKANGTFASFEL